MSNMDNIRESMAQELVRLSARNDAAMVELENLKELKTKFAVSNKFFYTFDRLIFIADQFICQNMEGKYNALLQMYGEKVEEAQELRMDLQDVKDMYRVQIDHLLQQKT